MSYFTCGCGNEIDTTDWIENWSNNEDEFHVTCEHCGDDNHVRVVMTVDYEHIGDLH